jgi:hypothetical protein
MSHVTQCIGPVRDAGGVITLLTSVGASRAALSVALIVLLLPRALQGTASGYREVQAARTAGQAELQRAKTRDQAAEAAPLQS